MALARAHTRSNVEWHRQNVMPKNPSLEQRVRWHVVHARVCGCREMPWTVVAELERRGRTVPTRRSPVKPL